MSPRNFRHLWNYLCGVGVVTLLAFCLVLRERESFSGLWKTKGIFSVVESDRTKFMTQSPTLSSNETGDTIGRWNVTQLEDALRNGEFQNLSIHDRGHMVPKPVGEDVELYNIDAWHRLQTLLTMRPSGTTPIRLCSVGGSSTAGGGGVAPLYKWDEQFVALLRATTTS